MCVSGCPKPNPTQAITTKFGMGILFQQGSKPSMGQPKMLTRMKFLVELIIRRGPANKILFLGAHSNLKPTESIPPKGGVWFWAILLKFGRWSLIHLALMVGWLPHPWPSPRHYKFFLLDSLDQSARDHFVTKLRNSPGQHWVAHASKIYSNDHHTSIHTMSIFMTRPYNT